MWRPAGRSRGNSLDRGRAPVVAAAGSSGTLAASLALVGDKTVTGQRTRRRSIGEATKRFAIASEISWREKKHEKVPCINLDTWISFYSGENVGRVQSLDSKLLASLLAWPFSFSLKTA